MGDKHQKGYWAGCRDCEWLACFDTRAEAADAQVKHDARHKGFRLTKDDLEFLKSMRISPWEDAD